MSRHVVAPVSEIPPGARKVVEAGGKRIVVFNLDGEFFALLDRCPHQGSALSGGIQCGLTQSEEPGTYRFSRAGEFIRCPWHQWEFDIRTGKSWFDPRRTKVRPFPVGWRRGGAGRGPYQAETVRCAWRNPTSWWRRRRVPAGVEQGPCRRHDREDERRAIHGRGVAAAGRIARCARTCTDCREAGRACLARRRSSPLHPPQQQRAVHP